MQTKEQREQQAVNDHLKAQSISLGRIRRRHPRQWQKYKLSNISTVAFLQEMAVKKKTTEELMIRLPLIVRQSDTALRVCEAKIEQLRRLKLIDYVSKPGTWELTGLGHMALNKYGFNFRKPADREHQAFGLYLLRMSKILINETTGLFANKSPSEVLIQHKDTKGPAYNYISMACMLRTVMEDLAHGAGYDSEPFQLGMYAGGITERLRVMGHSDEINRMNK